MTCFVEVFVGVFVEMTGVEWTHTGIREPPIASVESKPAARTPSPAGPSQTVSYDHISQRHSTQL